MRGPVPPIRIYIHVLLQRLGVIAGNHFNGPYKVTERVLSLVSELFVAAFASASKIFKRLID